MITINIVEDIPEIRETVQRYIQQIPDMECKNTYPNAEQAIGGLIINKPQIVIMDIGLPDMNGIECMMKVKLRCPKMKFLMFTVFDSDEHVFNALKAGADGYILKQESPTQIIASIRELTQGGAPMSKTIAVKVLTSFRDVPVEIPSFEVLTSRQEEILQKLSKGFPYKLIANQLSISTGTVKQHIHKIYKKLEVNNKTEAINKYLGRNT